MVINIKANINKENQTDKDDINGIKEAIMKDNLNKVKGKDMESGSMMKEQNIKDNLLMILNMVMVSKYTKLGRNFKVYSNLVPKLMENCTIISKNRYK